MPTILLRTEVKLQSFKTGANEAVVKIEVA